MLRTADAVGIAAVIALIRHGWGNPNVIGRVRARCSLSGGDRIFCRGIGVVAAAWSVGRGDYATHGYAITDVDFTGPTAIVVGSEMQG